MWWLLVSLGVMLLSPWLGIWALLRRLGRLSYRVDRHAYWIGVHHPLIPTSASPEEVRRRGYWSEMP